MQDEIGRHLETIRNLQISRQKSLYASGHGSYRTGGAPTQPMMDFIGQETYVMDAVKGKVRGGNTARG